MTERVVTECVPASDVSFRTRVQELLRGSDAWNLGSAEGLALMQTLLRGSYPMATVDQKPMAAVADGLVALEIRRDGTTHPEVLAAVWLSAVYDRHAAQAYALAVRIAGDRELADRALVKCFRWIAETVPPTVAIESVATTIRAKVCETAIAVLRAPHNRVVDVRKATPALVEWWRDPDLPRTLLSSDYVYIDANDAAARLFGVSRSSILGVAVGSFTRRESDRLVGRQVFAMLREVGEVTSTAVVVRPDGSERPIDFHAAAASTGTVTVMRERQEA